MVYNIFSRISERIQGWKQKRELDQAFAAPSIWWIVLLLSIFFSSTLVLMTFRGRGGD